MTKLEQFRCDCSQAFMSNDSYALRKLVFGCGKEDQPELMLIGEAPGEQETLQGKPFVGKAGKNLDAFLEAIHIDRNEIYISNVVKVRPTKISPAGRIVNRPPDSREKSDFLPWLQKEIVLVSPKILVSLGNIALQAFLPKEMIGHCHGEWQTVQVGDKEYMLFPLYHPASIIYNRFLQTVYENDLRKLADSLHSKIQSR